jgi:hypothetical protein
LISTAIKNRKNKPSYQSGAQDSFSLLVFEAMGSVKNPTYLVFCEAQLNSHKERFWSRKGLEVLTAKKLQFENVVATLRGQRKGETAAQKSKLQAAKNNLKEEIRRKERPSERYTSSTRTLCKGF